MVVVLMRSGDAWMGKREKKYIFLHLFKRTDKEIKDIKAAQVSMPEIINVSCYSYLIQKVNNDYEDWKLDA